MGMFFLLIISILVMVGLYKLDELAKKKGKYWSNIYWGKSTLFSWLFYAAFVWCGILVVALLENL